MSTSNDAARRAGHGLPFVGTLLWVMTAAVTLWLVRPPAPLDADASPDEAAAGRALQVLERIEPDLAPDPEELLGEVPPDDEAPSLDELAAPTAMERFVGWGFRDWMEVRDARPEAERVLRRQLERL